MGAGGPAGGRHATLLHAPFTRRRSGGRGAAASLLTGGAVASVSRPTPGAPGVGDPYYPLYGNGGYEARAYDLAVRYNPASGLLQGRTRILARATQDLSRFDLDLVGFTVRSITVDGAPATWTRQPHELVVRPGAALRRDHAFTAVIAYDGVPQPFTNPSGDVVGGFLKTPDGGIAVGEPEVAAQWFPVNDHPRDKATYRISLTVPRQFQALSNGLPGPRRVRGDWATTAWRTRDPMVSYLAFLAVGHFTVHRWRTSYGLPVIDAIDSGITGSLRRRIESSLAKQGEMIAAESRWFGPYPFEAAGGVIDQVDIGFALENQTRPTYDPTFWDGPDAPGIGDDVVAHELAHQWYGDSVALRRWQDIWLNEGFATYAEWLWSEHLHRFTPQQIFDQNYEDTPAGDKLWALTIGDPGPSAQFAYPVYLRGGMTLQALRMTVGTDAFFRILRTWAHDRRNGHGTTPEFIALAERISGKSLDGLFHDWLFTAVKPPRPTTASARSAATTAGTRSAQADAAIERWTTAARSRLARWRRSRDRVPVRSTPHRTASSCLTQPVRAVWEVWTTPAHSSRTSWPPSPGSPDPWPTGRTTTSPPRPARCWRLSSPAPGYGRRRSPTGWGWGSRWPAATSPSSSSRASSAANPTLPTAGRHGCT